MKQNIPGLGPVMLHRLSYGIMTAAYERSIQAKESERPTIFADFVLSYMFVDPPQTPEDIADLSDDAIATLVDIVVDEWGIRKEFDNTPTDLAPQDRLYQAHLESFTRLLEPMQQAFVRQQGNWQKAIQQMVAHRQENWRKIEQAVARRVGVTAGFQEAMQRAVARQMEAVAGFQEAIQRAVAHQMRAVAHQMEAVAGFQEAIQRQVQWTTSLGEEFGEAISRYLKEARSASEVIGDPLVQAGFWMPPSAPLDLLFSLQALVDKGESTPENIRQTIVDYCEEEGFGYLKLIVNDWQNNPYFAERMCIISDALDAHIDGKYTLSIPALLPLIEGILTDIVGRRATRADGGIRGWTENAIESMYSDTLREAYKDALLAYVTGTAVYGYVDAAYFTPQRFPEWLELNGLTGDQVLQRHAILHGVQMNYASKENSLRAFFLLDVLSWVNREDWDPRVRAVL